MTTVKRLSRPYARAVAGLLNEMQYNVDTRSFSLAYSLDTSIEKPTEIYISPLVYPNASYNISVNENIKWKVDPIDSNIILIEPVKERIHSGEKNAMGVINISPKG